MRKERVKNCMGLLGPESATEMGHRNGGYADALKGNDWHGECGRDGEEMGKRGVGDLYDDSCCFLKHHPPVPPVHQHQGGGARTFAWF